MAFSKSPWNGGLVVPDVYHCKREKMGVTRVAYRGGTGVNFTLVPLWGPMELIINRRWESADSDFYRS